ncbi:hypothetical protein HIM_08906 [Hirsutella minnesotensis 3608]|uniref:Nucleoporin NUP37 n=1 Tax=Hirsutella minnesotensis 3608 TaxID=1043627 RepID=A0A0F8A3E9_9HYPO|nr:hypothetical protein HIM_08906 [Hirsutella minnesotensis 3608]
MSFDAAPRIRRTAQNTQFTYNLSRRVNHVQAYPVQSPQGATVLIYAHENGVTLVWRGGRRLKSPKTKAGQSKANGTPDDVIMIIDSDEDDQPPAKAQSTPKYADAPSFEDAIEQTPYPEIIQTLDLALGTSVLHVAVVPMAPCAAKDAAENTGVPVLAEKMVFAVSCVTKDVYLITLPLTPPSPESKARTELRSDLLAGKAGSGAWGESLLLLGGQSRHSDGLAMNLVKPKESSGPQQTRAVVAAHSGQASGTLLLWEVPFEFPSKQERPLEPFQTEFLPHPLSSISFNPTHNTQLLTVATNQAVRVYDLATSSLPPDPDAVGPFPPQGSWLLSLYQPFARPSSSRKPILDAAWISHGRAVFALLADGMWGIWDIDGVSPSAPGAIISNKLKPGVQGAALTAFSVSGYVEGTSLLRSMASQPKENQLGEFAPMTPHTRRQVTASLGSANTLDRLSSVRGGVKKIALPQIGRSQQDESLALWIGGQDHVCVIPAVSLFWDAQLRRGHGGGVNLFSGAQPTRMVKLLDLATGLLGERCCGVSLVLDTSSGERQMDQEGGLPVEVLIQGETRMVVVRHGEDGPGTKIGGVVDRRRNRLFSRGERSDAIIVHGKSDRVASMTYNLSTVKSGSLRLKQLSTPQHDAVDGKDDSQQLAARMRNGFGFMNNLDEAADASPDLNRDIEAEMLDIMEIDQALDSMEDSRGSGRKKVFFEEG